jgi:hypothetical protein
VTPAVNCTGTNRANVILSEGTPRNLRNREADYDVRADAAFQVMTDLQKKLASQQEPDQYKLFGDRVAHKIRALPIEYARNTVKFHINNILYRASLG